MRGMVPEDVYELTGATDPRLSPDGSTVAYVVWTVGREGNDYPSAIHLIPTGGGEPRRLTAGTKHDASPRWSPDGARLAFTSNRDGDESQLYVIPVDGGEPQRLTEMKESVSSPVWSPDGRSIAFVARVRDAAYDEEDERKRAPRRITTLRYKHNDEGWVVDRRAHIFVVPADGSAPPRQLTDGDFEDSSPVWSPDGATIAFSSSRHPDWDLDPGSDIFVVAATGGEPRALTKTDGWYGEPAWSPDGARIACQFNPGLMDDPRHTQIGVVDVATGGLTLLTTSLDRNCAPYPSLREPIWDGDDIVFSVEDRGNTHIYRAPADGSGKPELVVGGEQAVTGFDVARGVLVHAATNPVAPSELYSGDTVLTSAGRAFTQGRALVAPERYTAVSKDGTEVDAWVMRPVGFEQGKRYPALLSIHGGPFTQYGNKLFDEFQVWCNAGYVVLFCNPRGSSGYAEAWGRAIRGPAAGAGPGWGSVDYEDCMAAVDTALERFDFVDPDRLGVLGGSYGGYMTSWIVSHTDRFAAACSERAVNDMSSFFGSSDFGWWFRSEIGAYRYEDEDAYRRMSPITYATNIHTPLLIMHSEEDLRCHVEQAEQLFTTLRTLRREVEFVRFPKETHELSRSGSPVHRVMRFEVILDWFARYLTP